MFPLLSSPKNIFLLKTLINFFMDLFRLMDCEKNH